MVSRTLPTDPLSGSHRDLAIHSLGSARPLGEFTCNPTTWKLALLIYLNDNLNISDVIAALLNRFLGLSGIVRFIHDWMAQGSIAWRQCAQKSEKHSVLHPDLRK